MKCEIRRADDSLIAIVEATPECGEDFCDGCGDCLHCYVDDPCPSGGHRWIVYDDMQSERAAELLAARTD